MRWTAKNQVKVRFKDVRFPTAVHDGFDFNSDSALMAFKRRCF